jgi:hypothetical protein
VRTIPWVREVSKRYTGKGLTIVGIHTPEFDHERDPAAVLAEVRRHGLEYSHLLDNDHAYWDALGNQYWPSLYLVDRCGRIRLRHIGEVHSGEESGRELETAIERLLAEPHPECSGG